MSELKFIDTSKAEVSHSTVLELVDFSIEEKVHYNHDQEPYKEAMISIYLDSGNNEDLIIKSTLEQIQYLVKCIIDY